MQLRLIAGALAAVMLTSTAPAHADAASALHTFYANMGRVGMSIGLKEQEVRSENTLVRGMYSLQKSGGQFVGYINEAGTLFGGGNGLQVVPAVRGQNLRKMTPQEVAGFRAEVMNNLDYDKLIKVNYGAGNDRKQVMVSAVDCGYCQKFEEEMAKNASKLNTTIYVLPTSLKNLQQGRAQWQTVSRIGCAEDRGEAWKAYWQTMKAPAAPAQCGYSPQTASEQYSHLSDIFRVAGIPIKGTPTFVREDGSLLPHSEARYLSKSFGKEGAVPTPDNPQQWLVAGVAAPEGEALPATAQGQPQQQGAKKIKLNDALKSLFN